MKKNLFIIYSFLVIGVLSPIFAIKAQIDYSKTSGVEQESAFEQASGFNSGANISDSVAMIISIVLGFLAILFVSLMLYAGFMWMTAQGDESKVEKARGIIIAAIIGLLIIISAYAITYFVFKSLNDSVYTLQ